MEYDDLGIPLKETIEEFKSFIEKEIKYNKLVWTKRMGELSSYLLLLVLLLAFGSFVLLFVSFAFAGWFGDITGLGIGTGYIVVAAFYALLGVLVFIYRQKLIFNPARKILGRILFDDDESINTTYTFESKRALSEHIKKEHEALTEQKEKLNNKINELGNSITFTNIAHQIIGKAYDSFLTTTNIAKFAFNMVKKIKSFTEKRKRKEKRNQKKLDKS
ncbi:MAG: hypothetical protein QM503_02675 [Bacteroidota bacterium]